MTKALAIASPEKRLFVSLITRDITLADAILDLIDNSVNAALRESAGLTSAKAFFKLLRNPSVRPTAEIRLEITPKRISITDNAGGIQFGDAKDGIFRFGAAEGSHSSKDRLSVFGIGMKRALFKIGNRISIVSDHSDGGFEMKLNVEEWEKLKQDAWAFDIFSRPRAKKSDVGTEVRVTELHEDVARRVSDGTFVSDLTKKISKTYSYFLGRLVKIIVNGESVAPVSFDLGSNFTNETFKEGRVEYNITVGISRSTRRFTGEYAGWFVFCNGRALLYADKTDQTGWGAEILPTFQPKHRPFMGFVFFYSDTPEELPWTTTKDSVNRESAVWQSALRHMGTLARPVVKVLDERYSNDGTDLTVEELSEISGEQTNSLAAAASGKKTFKLREKAKTEKTKIQYDAEKSEIAALKKYLGESSISATKIGRLTFEYYLRNVVGVKVASK